MGLVPRPWDFSSGTKQYCFSSEPVWEGVLSSQSEEYPPKKKWCASIIAHVPGANNGWYPLICNLGLETNKATYDGGVPPFASVRFHHSHE